MYFDVVIGNPPYQLGKNSNFYIEFIKMCDSVLVEDGRFAMVTPNRYCINGGKLTNEMNKNQIDFVRWNSSDHFPKVGTFIGYFISQKSQDPDNSAVHVKFDTFDMNIDFTKCTIPPKNISDKITIDIINKFLSFEKKCKIVDEKSDGTAFVCRQWKGAVKYGYKGVMFNVFEEDGDGRHYLIDGQKNHFIWFVGHSSLMRFVANTFASGMNVIPLLMKNIPDIGFSEEKTDDEILDIFGLTEKEKQYIKVKTFRKANENI